MIKFLSLFNFRNHAQTSLDLDRFTLLLGPNGAGKTSVLDAIAWGLLGENRLTDGAGKGADAMRMTGSKVTSVRLEIAGWGVVQRDLNKRQLLALPDRDGGSVAANQAFILERFHVPVETLLAILDPKPFLFRPANEQKEILLKLLRPPKIEPTPPLILAGISEIRGIEHLNALLKSWKEETLRDLNREKRTLQAQKIEAPKWPLGERSEDDVRKALQKAREDRETLLRKIAVAQALLDRDRKSQTEDGPSGLLSDIEAQNLRKELATIEASVKSWEADVEQLTADYAAARSEAAAAEQRAVEHRQRAAQFTSAKFEPHCETCTCPMEERKAIAQAEANKAKKAQDEAQREAEQGWQRTQILDARRKELREKIDAETKKARSMRDGLARHNAAKEQSARRESPETVQGRIERTNAELAAYQTRITEAQAVIDALERDWLAVGGYNEEKRAGEDHARRYISLINERLPSVQRVVDELDRLRQQIMESGAGPFLMDMAGFLAPFGLTAPEYDPESGFRVGGLPAWELSGGEQAAFFEAALRFAAAKRAKFPLIVLDQMAPVDEENRRLLMDGLFRSDCQVIAAWTTTERPKPKRMVGVRRYWIEAQEGRAVVSDLDLEV